VLVTVLIYDPAPSLDYHRHYRYCYTVIDVFHLQANILTDEPGAGREANGDMTPVDLIIYI